MPIPKNNQNNQNISGSSSKVSDGKNLNIPEPVMNIGKPLRELIDLHTYSATIWKDNAYSSLVNNRLEPVKESTIKYLADAWTIIDVLDYMLKKAESLDKQFAGLGNWLSFRDSKMVIKREISKWFDGDGWGSTL
jgi:hypothetical protein